MQCFRIFICLLFFSSNAYANALEKFCAQPEQSYRSLLDGMSHGQYRSLVHFIRCRDFHDGGNLGDLYIEANLLFEEDPFLYSYILEKENFYNADSIMRFFNFLHPKFVDDYAGKASEYKKRIALANAIEDDAFRDKVQLSLEKSYQFSKRMLYEEQKRIRDND